MFRKRNKDVLKPNPIFTNPYLTNVQIYDMDRQFYNPNDDSILWNFYTALQTEKHRWCT